MRVKCSAYFRVEPTMRLSWRPCATDRGFDGVSYFLVSTEEFGNYRTISRLYQAIYYHSCSYVHNIWQL
jgi:hypothetical protein